MIRVELMTMRTRADRRHFERKAKVRREKVIPQAPKGIRGCKDDDDDQDWMDGVDEPGTECYSDDDPEGLM